MKPADVVALPWDSDASRGGHALVVGAERSEEGSTGVYFVELTGRRVFVIKVTRPDQFIPELFGNALAKCFDVPAPDMQPVGRHTPLGRAIIEGLLRFEAKMHNHEKYWISSKLQIISSFAHHFFFVMEYVPGKSLFEADQLESEKTEAAAEKGSASAEEAKRDDWLRSAVRSDPSLESFGAVVALDMILNNLDRVRTARSWPESNPENIFLSRATGQVVAIDSVAAWGDYAGALGESSFRDRMREIENVVAELFGDETRNSEAFRQVQKLLRDGLSDTPLANKMWLDETRVRNGPTGVDDDEPLICLARPGRRHWHRRRLGRRGRFQESSASHRVLVLCGRHRQQQI